MRAAACLTLLLSACALRPPGPEQTLRRWLERVNQGQISKAWRMTSPAYREQCDLPCFQRLVQRNHEELHRALGALRAGAVRSELRLELSLPPETVVLVQRPGQPWLLSGDPLDFYPQNTPAAALRSFVRAIEARRYAVALRFVPQRLREQISEQTLRQRWEGPHKDELRNQLEAVKRHLSEPFLIEGQQARLPVGEQREARLVLEQGRWCVLQLQ